MACDYDTSGKFIKNDQVKIFQSKFGKKKNKKQMTPAQVALKKKMQMDKLKNKISMVRNITRSKVYTSMEGEKLPLEFDENQGFTKIRIKRNNFMPS